MAEQSKSFYSLPKRQIGTTERKSHLAQSAAQILQTPQPQPQQKQDIFGEIYGALSSTTRSQVTTLPEDKPRNAFLLDESLRKQRDAVIKTKWGEQPSSKNEDVNKPIPQTISKLKQQQPRQFQMDDILLAKNPEEFLQSNDSIRSLKNVIAEQIASQIRDQMSQQDQEQKKKQDAIRDKVINGTSEPTSEVKTERPKLRKRGETSAQIQPNIDEQQGNEVLFKPSTRFASLPDLDVSSPFQFFSEPSKQQQPSEFTLDEPRQEIQTSMFEPPKSTAYQFAEEKPALEISEGTSQDKPQKTSQDTTSTTSFQYFDKNTEWNFQNKVYLNQKISKKPEIPQVLNSSYSTKSISQEVSVKRMPPAWKKSSGSKKQVRFNTVTFVQLVTGEFRQEPVQDTYRVKKINANSNSIARGSDVSKLWGF